MNRILKRSLAWTLMLAVTLTMCFGSFGSVTAYAAATPALSIFEGDKHVKDYSTEELEKIAEKEGDVKYNFAGYNRNPSWRTYKDVTGPTIKGILADAGINVTDDQLLTFVAPDQAREAFIAADLFADRYYYPKGDLAGNLGAAAGIDSYAEAQKVQPIINLESKEDGDTLLLLGQIAPNERNVAVHLKYIADGGTLIIGGPQKEAWPAITQANYNGGEILPETKIEFNIDAVDGKKVGVYYTTDGTEPTYGDAIYNYNKYGDTRTISFAKEGTYTVKVKVIGFGKLDSETTTFTYVVKDVDSPAVPTGFSAEYQTSDSAGLEWNSVNDADGYEVMRYDDENKIYNVIGDVTDATSYVDTGLEAKTYKYKVRAYKKLSSGQKVYSSATSAENVVMKLDKAVLTKVARTGYSSIQINWNKVKDAQGYEIYRYDGVTKKWISVKKITSGNTVSWKNTNLKTGRKYTYKVRAYAGKLSGAFSYTKSATPTLSTPSISKVTAGKKSATVRWSKITGASGYKVYRSTSKNSGYKVVKTVKSGSTTSWKNAGLKKGKKYYYKVKAYRIVDKKYVYSNISSSKYTKSK